MDYYTKERFELIEQKTKEISNAKRMIKQLLDEIIIEQDRLLNAGGEII